MIFKCLKIFKVGKCQSREGTITLTNFGALSHGGLFATPIINYPEAAILGVARIHKQPHVKGENLVLRDLLNSSWSFDHRIIDGKVASEVAASFSHLIENPAMLL